jgi:hypothetical protein
VPKTVAVVRFWLHHCHWQRSGAVPLEPEDEVPVAGVQVDGVELILSSWSYL